MSDTTENLPASDIVATHGEKDEKAAISDPKAATKKSPPQAWPGTQGSTLRPGNLPATLALVIAIAGIAGGYMLWRRLNDTRENLTNRDNRTEAMIDTIRPEVNLLKSRLHSFETQFDARLEQGFSEIDNKQELLQESLDSLQKELGRKTRDDWTLAEAEYLLRIANNRLLLEQDIDTAITALTMADARLRDIGNPALVAVRKKLAHEITALEAIEKPDITGMGLALSGLQERIDLLPAKGESLSEAEGGGSSQQPVESPGESGLVDRFFDAVRSALKSLVTIRRIDEAETPLIPPEQRAFLKHNLRLQLEAARIALFRNDNLSYHSSLKTAREWLTRYFNVRAGSTASMVDNLTRLDEVKLDPPLPDISGSLSTLRQLTAEKSATVIKQNKNTP